MGAWAGWLRLERKECKEAEEVFVALTREPGTKNDPYAWLGLATLNLMSAPSDQKKVCVSRAAASWSKRRAPK